LIAKIRKKFKNKFLRQGLSDSKYYALANIGTKFITLFITPFIARIFSVEEFAVFDIFFMVNNFLILFLILGIDSGIAILISESKSDGDKLSFLYIISLISSFTLLLFIGIIFYFLFYFYDNIFLLNYNIWIMVFSYAGFKIINATTFNILRWMNRAKIAALINFVSASVGTILGFIFVYFGSTTVETYLLGVVMGVGIGSLFSLYISKELIFNFKIIDNSKAIIIDLFRLSLPFVPNSLGNVLMQMADRLVIVTFLGVTELGYYAILLRVVNIPVMIVRMITSGFLPVMFKNYSTQDGAAFIKKVFHIYFWGILFAIILIFLVKEEIIWLIAGDKYLNAAYLLPLSMASALIISSTGISGFGYSIKRKTEQIMYITFFTLFINFIISILFGLIFGLVGVIIGTLIAGVVRVLLYVYYSEKLYSFDYNYRFIVGMIIFISLIAILATL
jgi:O-antigen/teichoic acid export membrane protein